MTAQFLRKIKCAVKFASEQHKREAGWLERMGFVSLCEPVFIFASCIARLLPFIVLCDLKLLQVSALFGGPLTQGAQGKLPLLPPPPLLAALGDYIQYLTQNKSNFNLQCQVWRVADCSPSFSFDSLRAFVQIFWLLHQQLHGAV